MHKLLLLVFSLTACSVSADPYRFPLRSFGSKAANLTPLFEYWKAESLHGSEGSWKPPTGDKAGFPEPKHPLPAWKLIRGTVVEVRPYAFIVDAEIFERPGKSIKKRIFLYRAPCSERETFMAMRGEVDNLVAYQNAQDRVAAMARQEAIYRKGLVDEAYRDWLIYNDYDVANNASEVAYVQSKLAKRAAAKERRAVAESAAAEKRQIELFEASEHYSGTPDHYTVETFALDMKAEREGLPLFNTGINN